MKTLLTYKFTDKEFQSLRDLGYHIIYKNERDIELTDEIKDVDNIICFDPFNNIDLDLFPNLKWVQVLSTGINHVPKEKIINNNITLTNNRGGYSIPISEWTVLKILEMLKNSKEFQEKQREKIWKVDTSLLELHGKTVGFLGTGSIAKDTAKRLKPFGVKLLGMNTDGKDVEYFDETYKFKEIENLVPKLDILVIAASYTKDTHQLIDQSVLSNMKDNSYIVNIARGSIIDEKALINSLNSGKIKKAALDVFEEEPLPETSPLWDMDNVYLSPHNSWASEMDRKRKYDIAYKNMKKYINNERMENIIDFEKGY